MRQHIKNFGKFVFYFVFCLLFFAFESLKYIFTGKNLLAKFMLLAGYASVIFWGIKNNAVFIIAIGLFVIINLVYASIMMKSAGSGSSNSNSKEANGWASNNTSNTFFEGMSLDEAKKEYRRLMKKYHPDNIDGDLVMSQKVSAAYTQFCAMNRN